MNLTSKFLVAAVAMACSGAADARSVAEFLSSFQRVRDAGMSGMFAADAQSLMDEANGSLRAWKGQQATAKPRVCAPAGSEDMDPAAFVTLLHSVPEAKRSSTSVRTGVIWALNRRYPCR